MSRKVFWFVMLVLALVAVRASAQDCPIKYVNIWASGLKIQNVTDKAIIGIKFRPTYYDATNAPHEYYENLNGDNIRIKPNKTWRGVWHIAYWVWNGDYSEHNGAEWRLVAVQFEDGSTWIPDTPDQCMDTTLNFKDKRYKKK